MAWMSPNMTMETTTGGGMGKGFRENVFRRFHVSEYLYGKRFGKARSPLQALSPVEIRAFQVGPGQEYILQKRSFLASEAGVSLSVHFHKKVASGLFGGEGFILQKVSGSGIVFVEFDGSIIEYELGAGQKIIVDTGNLAAMSATCKMDIQTVPGLKK